MSRKTALPNQLSKEQMQFWLANTNLTMDQITDWYKQFYEFAQANQNKLDKDNFVKFFVKLEHSNNKSKRAAEEKYYGAIFKGKN